jgi:hypothetical protein
MIHAHTIAIQRQRQEYRLRASARAERRSAHDARRAASKGA